MALRSSSGSFLSLLVQIGVAGGAGHGLAQRRARFFSCGSWGPSSAAIWSRARATREAKSTGVPERDGSELGGLAELGG